MAQIQVNLEMNHLIAKKAILIDTTHNLRTEILEAITDPDLTFSLGGSSLSFAELLLEQGTFQMAYTKAFGSFELVFDATAPAIHTVAEFKTWFETLDQAMMAALEQLSDTDLKKTIARGTWGLPAETTFFTYRESVFIFAAKASVYLRALGKPLPTQLLGWVA